MTFQFRINFSILFLLFFVIVTFQAMAASNPTATNTDPQKSTKQTVQSLIDEFSKKGESLDCNSLNKLALANLKRTDEVGVIAKTHALTALMKPARHPEKNGKGCIYNDKKTAFHIAVEMYKASAQISNWHSRESKHILSSMVLESGLGKDWREQLASAGIGAAMQELVVLNLTCERKEIGQTNAFWDWMMTDAGKKKHDPTFEGLLQILARSHDCKSLIKPAQIKQACYWNELENKLAPRSHGIIVTGQMLRIRNDILMLPKAKGTLDTLSKLCKPRDIQCFNINFQKKLRKLISSGCKAILSAPAYKAMTRRANEPLQDTLENLIRKLD